MAELVLPTRTIAGLKIVKASERTDTFNMLVYGNSGVGKTRLLGSADELPGMRKVLFVDVEAGTLSIKDIYPNVDVLTVNFKDGWKKIADIYEWLKAGNHEYRTVVIDSVTEMQKFNMSQVMIDLIQQRPDLDADVPGMREWGKNLEQMRKYVRYFRDLPMNTLFTALSKAEKNTKTGALHKKPSLSGKLADEIAGFLDIVCYMYTKEVDGEQQRLLLTGSTEDTIAKDRSDRLPMVVQQPTMKLVMDYVTGKTNKTPAKEA